MATDLIVFSGPYQIVERSAATFTAKFRDTQAGEYVTPTNAYWRIDDEDGCEVVGWTSVSIAAEATSVSISVSAEQNRVRNCTRLVERHTLTVMADRDLATQFAAAYTFAIKNLAWRT